MPDVAPGMRGMTPDLIPMGMTHTFPSGDEQPGELVVHE